MAFHPPEQLVVGELLLRWAVLEDAQLMADTIRASLEHLRPWMPWAADPTAGDVEAQRTRRAEMLTETAAGRSYLYLVLDGEHLVGAVGMHRRIGPRALEIGYWLTSASVGKGYVTRAVEVLTREALALDDVERVEIHCDEANLRSQGVPRRLGFVLDRVEDDGKAAPAESGRGMVWVFPGPDR